MNHRARVVVLGSGVGSNFEALAAHADANYEIVAVGSDRRTAPILDRAGDRGISTFVVAAADYPDCAAHDTALAAALTARRPDWIALAGYLRILGSATLAAWPERILNIHPALLPNFPGLDTHRRALAAGACEHGATVHFVTAALDAGPRILQARLAVHEDDTETTLHARVQALEHRIYPRALDWCASGRVSMKDGIACMDGMPLTAPIIFDEDSPCD
ncbi:MAG: phosphoribosylglycinamide formyltransferase [Gammaproteobacteria bacterium]